MSQVGTMKKSSSSCSATWPRGATKASSSRSSAKSLVNSLKASKVSTRTYRSPSSSPAIWATIISIFFFGAVLLVCAFFMGYTKSDQDRKGHSFFGPKTTYLNARQENVPKFGLLEPFLKQIPTTCEPVHLYFIVRHGIRYPRNTEMSKLNLTLYKTKKGFEENKVNFKGNVKARDEILQWHFPLSLEQHMLLTKSGENETQILASFFYSYFPTLLNVEQTRFRVEHSTSSRTKQTAQAFISRLYIENDSKLPSQAEIDSKFPMTESDAIAHVNRAVKPPKSQGPSMEGMAKGETAKQLEDRLNDAFGFAGYDTKLSFTELYHLYLYCSYELAHDDHSPWCDLVTPEDLQLMEFMVDITDYWKKYAPLEHYVGPIIMKDALQSLEKSVKENSGNGKVVTSSMLYFSHDSVFKSLIVYLKFFPPYPNSTVVPKNLDREWHGGNAMPFNVNIALVLYRCRQEGASGSFKVLPIYNEVPLSIPGCTEKLCDFEEFTRQYKDVQPVKPTL